MTENNDLAELRRVNETPTASISTCSLAGATPNSISVSSNWPHIKTDSASENKQFEAIVVLTEKNRDMRSPCKGTALPA